MVIGPGHEGGVRGAEVKFGEEGATAGAGGGEYVFEDAQEAKGEDDGAADSEGFGRAAGISAAGVVAASATTDSLVGNHCWKDHCVLCSYV